MKSSLRLLPLLAILGLAACNTMAGAGRDIQSGGAALTGEARKTQAQM
ncbi:entericidin EcnAB [Haematobacter massiliensis]|uniref:Entericidin EcnAB n=1 Tax=Haematobacter massiliensis TaxID=195105 RepID=A0A086YD25_9RHOB|nr:entericidin A/B family lipoprotein [Haematobacter massiliensis]KFI32175.1 entericidin EcnAB [Haematobacter massiliensis]OWJ72767.1 entericidin EcnAB [Haematobacter massiliensis]OWJ85810.1 entericidin EcnAB [Haematobacter massiliensis]QBJ24554.1 entericidin A/B family lipoprotein [Haematobacter massiliensis]